METYIFEMWVYGCSRNWQWWVQDYLLLARFFIVNTPWSEYIIIETLNDGTENGERSERNMELDRNEVG